MNKVRLGRTDLMVTPICFGTSGLGDMPDTYGYGVDDGARQGDDAGHFRRAGQFHRYVAHLRHGSQRGADRRRHSRARRPARGASSSPPSSTAIPRPTSSTPRRRAARSSRASRRWGSSGSTSCICTIPNIPVRWTEATGRDGALGELFRIKEEGLAKAVGLAAGPVTMMMPLLRDWDFDALITHNRFTLANRNAEEMLDLAQSRGDRRPQRGALCRRRPRQGVERLSPLCLSGGVRRGARSNTPHRGDLRASRRAARAPRRCSFPCATRGSRRRSAA